MQFEIPHKRPPTILIADDNDAIVGLVQNLLSKPGYNVITASDGQQAFDKARTERPDLVILDIMMPKVDGLTVCKRLKTDDDTRLIPVIMLTSKDYVEDRINGLESGADDYITKPFNSKEFIVRVKGIIDKTIYQHRRAEEEKLDALEMLVEGIAHEVRNPIVAIGGFARRIRERLPDDDVLLTYADHITREVERLEGMVNEIIKLKTIVVDTGRRIDVRETLRDVLTNFSADFDEKHIEVETVFSNQIPLVRGDSRHLGTAFSHLVANALDAMESGGHLTVSVECSEDQLLISFVDTGKGVDAQTLPIIVRPFYTSKMTGAGMGLTMVNHIAVLHGGSLDLASTAGQGTRATIVLPVKTVHAQAVV